MKKFVQIIKISCLSLCSVFIAMQVFILANTNRIAEITAELELAKQNEDLIDAYEFELIEIYNSPEIPLADFSIGGDNETDNVNKTDETDAIEIIDSKDEIGLDNNITDEVDSPDETKETDEIGEIEITTEAEANDSLQLKSKNLPVLMYHTSSEYNPEYYAELYVKPSEFEKQVQYLSENGFTFCTFDDYYNLDTIDKPVFITFDDGYKENYTEIFPILQKYNVKITIFLMLNHILDTNITKEMIVEMNDSGLVKFESHTVAHLSLVSISGNDALLTEELENSKLRIEEMTGKSVLALAYPNGEFNDTVKEKTKEFYSFGLRKDAGMHNTEYDPYEVRRIRINRSTTMTGFINSVGH